MEELIATGLLSVVIAAWRALPLLAIVLAVDLILRRRIAPRFHCLLWMLVMVRMLCPVSISSSLSMQGPMDQLAGHLFSDAASVSDAEPGFDVFTYQNLEGESVSVAILPDDASDQQRADAEAYVASLATASRAYNVVNESQSGFDWAEVASCGLLGAWLFVAAVLLIRSSAGYLRFAARLRRSRTLTDQSIIDQVLRACDAVGARRRPILKEVDGLAAPAVFGLIQHTICLPPGTLQRLSADEIGWVLKHELAHIKRRDSLVLSVAQFMRACHWFNPLAWLVVSRLRNQMEQAADEIAIRDVPAESVVDYGRLLLKYAAEQGDVKQHYGVKQPATLGLLFVSTAKSLRQRIEMLDQNRRRNHWLAKTVAIAVVIVIAVTGLTDAKTISPEQKARIHLPERNIWIDSSFSSGMRVSDEPMEEVTYDVRGVLAKLKETAPSIDPGFYVTSMFGPFFPTDTLRLEDGKLTVKQTAQGHRNTKRMLHAWERSGAWQVTIECRVITADIRLARDIDWMRLGVVPIHRYQASSFPSQENQSVDSAENFPLRTISELAIETRDESVRSRPAVAAKITELESQLLIHRSQRDQRSNLLQSPKVTLFHGQLASIQSGSQRPFVTGVRPDPKLGGKMEPIIEVISEGWRMDIHTEVNEDEGVDLQCVVTESEIQSVDLANLPFLADDDPTTNVTVQVPSVARTSVRSSVRLAQGESLLVVSPTTFKSEDTDGASMATFYLITPMPISEQSIMADDAELGEQ